LTSLSGLGNCWLIFNFFIIVLSGNTLQHLQKLLQCIKYLNSPSLPLLIFKISF
jgi:hypothetical protein